MSYNQYPPPSHSPYPPYGGPPQGYPQQSPPYPPQQSSPYPPQQPGYGAPPPGPYQQPPPGGFAPPPHPPPSPHGYPPANSGYPQHPPGHSPYPPPQQNTGQYPPYPPPQQGGFGPGASHGAPQYPPQQGFQQGFQQGGPPSGPPAQPTPGYAVGQMAPGDYRSQADALRKAMKGFGTDEKALINVLAPLDPLQMAAVRSTYTNHIKRDLVKDVKSETSSYFKQGLVAVIDGPLMHDVACVRDAVEGLGTKEWLLNDVLLGRSNADLNAIKTAYEKTYRRSLQKDVEGDLSFKTLSLFGLVLRANRHEESFPIDPRTIETETRAIHSATSGTRNVEEVCSIFVRSSDNELRAINQEFNNRYHSSLEKHIEKEFSGHMRDALLQMLRTALDAAMRDAVLLEECMKGMGTKDEKLVIRVVRVHWNRQHKEQVKAAYRHKYNKDLIHRVRGETSGDYQRLMIALLE